MVREINSLIEWAILKNLFGVLLEFVFMPPSVNHAVIMR